MKLGVALRLEILDLG
jgi:hypothetical protein